MNFDRLAPHYDWLEAVTAGGRLQRARTCWLNTLEGRRRILSVGEGHGRFAEACLRRHPNAELTCVEASAAMVEVGRGRTREFGDRVHWVCGDILSWRPPHRYDAIATNFFLDCFVPEQLSAVVAAIADAAEEQAVWLVADFAVPESGLRRVRARAVHALMYVFFRYAVGLPARRLTDPGPLLSAHGFERGGVREFEWGLIRAEWRSRHRRV